MSCIIGTHVSHLHIRIIFGSLYQIGFHFKALARRRKTIAQITSDVYKRQVENGNDTGFIEKIANVGSEGTDILVKAMINIMLLNVFKEGASRKFKDFKLHCMMDEIGKLHPNNISGILKFANDRNIILINGSPTELNRDAYKHVYLLTKGTQNKTRIARLISDKQL